MPVSLHFSGGKPANPETAAACADRGRPVSVKRVDADISDIFFNTLHDAAEYEKDSFGRRFTGYNEARLRQAATDTLASLERLGVAVPTVDELIADFYGRL